MGWATYRRALFRPEAGAPLSRLAYAIIAASILLGCRSGTETEVLMRLNEIQYPDALPIDGYGPGFFRIGGTSIEEDRDPAGRAWAPGAGFDDVALIAALAGGSTCCFVGTGAEIAHLPARSARPPSRRRGSGSR